MSKQLECNIIYSFPANMEGIGVGEPSKQMMEPDGVRGSCPLETWGKYDHSAGNACTVALALSASFASCLGLT